jgi:MSHA biogenesis protein MshO
MRKPCFLSKPRGRSGVPPIRRCAGFTLVELIVVMVVGAVIAVGLVRAIQPAMESYVVTRVRSGVANEADVALQRMVRDVRQAVPNSLRMPASQCFEVVPGAAGGRYRAGPDTVHDSAPGCTPGPNCAAWVDPTTPTTVFDSLSALPEAVNAGDWVVIDNQNVNDVYEGTNRSAVLSVSTLSGAQATQGKHRITMNSMQIADGYQGGRFTIVRDAEQAVFYVCQGTGFDATAGHGTGTLYRLKRYGFNAAYPGACPVAASTSDVIATHVKSCSFEYAANQGATQQSGYLRLTIELARNHETTHLAVGAHVLNVP